MVKQAFQGYLKQGLRQSKLYELHYKSRSIAKAPTTVNLLKYFRSSYLNYRTYLISQFFL